MKTYRYQVTFVDSNGNRVTKEVDARHEFEATQLAGAFNCVIISIVNLDL